MIIDSHVHFGSILNFKLPKKDVLLAMEKYSVSKALVSDCEGAEFDAHQKPIPEKEQIPLIVSAKKTIDFAKDNQGKIFAAIWVKPHFEQPSAELEYLLKVHQNIVKAIKVHPFHSAISFDSPQVESFIELAQLLELPVITHTASDNFSACSHVYDMAKKYPDVKFIMAHMGLGTDNQEAIELCSKLPNLYSDTAWVPMENAIKFIEKCGSEKLLFGSDMPIDGVDTYSQNKWGQTSMYRDYFNKLEKLIPSKDFENIMWKNAETLFKM